MHYLDTILNEIQRAKFYPWMNEYKEELDEYLEAQAEITWAIAFQEGREFGRNEHK